MRYNPWGEVRYTWTTSLSTTPAYQLTRYTYTGQYSYMDDPTTSGTEGFGLMFYNARWYDPGLGRFAQADTIVPPGVQGLDRYAYVNNSPVNFTDPSGHRCVPEDECDTPKGDRNHGPLLTAKGKAMYRLYVDYKEKSGWWNADGDFTLEDFVGLWIYFESRSSSIDTWKAQGKLIASAVAQNLYVGGWNEALGGSLNAVLNFLGSWKDGKSGLGAGPGSESIQMEALYSGLDDSQKFMKELGQAALHPKTLNYDRDKGPSIWGNINGASDIKVSPKNFGPARDSVYFKNGSFVILSVEQHNYWSLTVDMSLTYSAH